MDTIRFRSQLSIAFKQALVRLHRAQNVLARPKRIFANKARALWYAFHAKARVRLHRAQNVLASPKRIFANKARALGYALYTRAKVRLRRAQNAMLRPKRFFINKARALGYVLHAKARVRLHRAQRVLATPKRIFANKARSLGYALRAKTMVRLHRAQKVLARPERIFANKARPLGYALRAKTKVRLYRAQNTLASLKGIVADKARGLGDVLRAKVIDLEQWLGDVLDAIVVLKDNTHEFASRLLGGLEQLTAPLRRTKNSFAGVRRRIAEGPQRLQKTILASENALPNLLKSSSDAMVVVNQELRFVGANAKALDVFGISEKNMTMFSMDAFLRSQILPYEENGAPLTAQKEWHGVCKIQRLDGSLRVVDFIFVANYVPLLHVCLFRNDRKWQREKRFAA